MFEELWQAYIQDRSYEKELNQFIEFLSLQYSFDKGNFTLYTEEGKMFHRRVPRNEPVENLE